MKPSYSSIFSKSVHQLGVHEDRGARFCMDHLGSAETMKQIGSLNTCFIMIIMVHPDDI